MKVSSAVREGAVNIPALDVEQRGRKFPSLPIMGWSAFAGSRAPSVAGIRDIKHRRYTMSGRAAIAIALRVLDVVPGQKVLVPTYHCTTMIAPVVQAGAQPVFYPITASGAPNLDWLTTADLTGVRAILAAHYFGLPQPMAVLRKFCDERGIALIEDCAHAFFGTSDGRSVGSWGDVAIASLTKFFPVTAGGLIVSDTLSLRELPLQSSSWIAELKATVDVIELASHYERLAGLNSFLKGLFSIKRRLRSRRRGMDIRANGVQRARSGDDLLALRNPPWVVRGIVNSVSRTRIAALRRRNYLSLAAHLAGLEGAHPIQPELPADAAPYVFPLYVENPTRCYQHLRNAGIPIFCWDETWPSTPAIRSDVGVAWSDHVFQLGCHQDLSLDDVASIASIVRTAVKFNRAAARPVHDPVEE